MLRLATTANVQAGPDGTGLRAAASGQPHGMDAKTVGQVVSASRMAFGAGLILSPPRFARSWTGPGASRRPARVIARSLGARELALGAGGLLALRGGDAQRWFALGALTEAVDVAVTLTDGPRTPSRLTGALMAAATAGAAAYVALSGGR